MTIQQHLAFVFPGQGSQQVGMLQELAMQHALVKEIVEEASSVLGYDMLDLMTQGPEEKLNQTEYTQPALLTTSVAIYRVLQTLSPIEPIMMAGHSLGEYTALVCVNSLRFIDAVQLVAERGRLMQAAVPENTGAMAAIIGLESADVAAVCHEAAEGAIVAPANINAIGQIVISGHKAAVERAVVIAKKMGAKIAKLIPVSVPSHCDLMRPAADKLSACLAATAMASPASLLIHNVDVTSHENPNDIRVALTAQLYRPVRWVETIQLFAQKGVTRILELGPGRVLTGLNKRIDNHIETLPVYDETSLNHALKVLDGGE